MDGDLALTPAANLTVCLDPLDHPQNFRARGI